VKPEAPPPESLKRARAAKACLKRPAVAGPSMEAVVERENLKKALARVKRNKGAAGVDGISVDDLPAYLKEHWPTIRAQLLEGTYQPQPVRRVEIPKASGGVRPLGIPTVLDRFIQQSVMQVLQGDWDPVISTPCCALAKPNRLYLRWRSGGDFN
jgi:RNA-directed DNA polymerase